MKPYAPMTNLGRKRAGDDIHHRTTDQPRAASKKAAKVARHGARQDGRRGIASTLSEVVGSAP